ncbi:Hypothetical predicted protein [Podarcis lilfordi]|uniref:Reverse transcriptase domain-containing protein n=1 Tax=Podarcis lilfordi TaxID=74358 RepID=A0AA35L5Y3_9SAUR|nr:Hypothetical predicted protein [Podarcis lilfordi]
MLHLHQTPVYEQNSWSLLLNASLNNETKLFWQLVSDSMKNSSSAPSCVIAAQVWENHFRNIFMENPNLPSSLQEDDRAELSLLPNWRPVTVEEVHTLIGNLKSGKAPGKDFIPAELITSNQHWWAPLLAALFTVVNDSGKVPYSWKHAIVVPVFKRGHPNVPSNYRPISLLSITGKLYARFLSSKLTTFLNEHNILSEAQAAFRENHSTTDHCLMLSFLAEKYTMPLQGKLFVAFMDLKSAFDSIPRSQLWSKLSLILQDKRLLFLIKALYNGTKLEVRCG